MIDPYKILGVNPSASDDEVKRAYRDLVKKYHPDKYGDNPLSDLAEEKMKEVNEAYDQIQRERSGSSNGSYNYGNGYGSQASGDGSVYSRIRRYIQLGNFAAAEQLLNSVPDKTAEWYFLYGALCQRKGWFDEALTNFQTACSMDPNNMEYRQALGMLQNSRGMYRGGTGGMGGGGLTGCGLCGDLLCADCCCECMGGDLIPCC